eukprot:gene4912-21248_t
MDFLFCRVAFGEIEEEYEDVCSTTPSSSTAIMSLSSQPTTKDNSTVPTFAHFSKPASRSKSAPQEEKVEAVAEGGIYEFVSFFRVPEIVVSVDDNH